MSRIENWREVSPKRFISLAGKDNASEHNVFVQDYGYLTDHIPPLLRRDNPDHWDAQFQTIEDFRKSWKPRNGPLELVDNLVRQGNKPFYVLNMGAGLGDFTVNLAQIPGVHVAHVDFSAQANRVASTLFEQQEVRQQVDVVTADNITFLNKLIKDDSRPDFIFFYGGLGDNTPEEEQIEQTLKLAAQVLKPGGHIWYVGLVQPFLEPDQNELVAADIIGEYSTRQTLIQEIMNGIPNMYLVRNEVGERPDKHPLKPGGEPEDHMHMILRALYAKELEGKSVVTPQFGFKDVVNPEWETRWQQITNNK